MQGGTRGRNALTDGDPRKSDGTGSDGLPGSCARRTASRRPCQAGPRARSRSAAAPARRSRANGRARPAANG